MRTTKPKILDLGAITLYTLEGPYAVSVVGAMAESLRRHKGQKPCDAAQYLSAMLSDIADDYAGLPAADMQTNTYDAKKSALTVSIEKDEHRQGKVGMVRITRIRTYSNAVSDTQILEIQADRCTDEICSPSLFVGNTMHNYIAPDYADAMRTAILRRLESIQP